MVNYDEAVCPKCGGRDLIPLVYGQPRWDRFREQEKNKFMFGGCMLKQNSKSWVCTSCGKKGFDKELDRIKEAPGRTF